MKLAPRWRRRKAERPRELVEAALTVFDRDGFTDGRLEDVADLAGVTRATIYLYFQNKEDVLRAVAEAFVPDLTNIETPHDAPPEARLVQVLSAVAEGMMQPRVAQTLRLVIGGALNFPDIARDYRDELIDTATTALANAIQKGVESGAFRKDTDILAAARVAVSGPIMIAMFQASWTKAFPDRANPYADPALAAAHAEILLRGLRAE